MPACVDGSEWLLKVSNMFLVALVKFLQSSLPEGKYFYYFLFNNKDNCTSFCWDVMKTSVRRIWFIET